MKLLTWVENQETGPLASWAGARQDSRLVGHQMDPAGWGHLQAVLKQLGLIPYKSEPEDSSDDADAGENGDGGVDDAASSAPSENSTFDREASEKFRGKAKKKKGEKDRKDYYALLGLENERFMATELSIRNAYKKVSLKHHPDKCGAATADAVTKLALEDNFKNIQEAYECLSNPVKRREYDSTDVFDDTLPDSCGASDWFKVFAPAFRRQARWSEVKPPADPGDDSLPLADVYKFYDFWFKFRSWREFPHPDEEDEEQAESRDHRRWIQRNNSKLRQKSKKEETRRLKEFVQRAYDLDPRIRRAREAEKAEKEKKKAAKQEERQRREDEEREKKEAEERRKAEEEAAAAAAREDAKKRLQEEKRMEKKERQRIRKLCGELTGAASDDDLDRLFNGRLGLADLREVGDALEASRGAGVAAGRAAVEAGLARVTEVEEFEEARRKEQAAVTEAALASGVHVSHRKKMDEMKEWSHEELRLLEKALKKYPVGTGRRWEKVTAHVRTRTQDEVLLMVKEAMQPGSPYNHILMAKTGEWVIPEKRQVNVVAAMNLEATERYDLNPAQEAAAAAAEAAEAEAAGGAAAAAAGGAAAEGAAAAAATEAPAPAKKAAPAAPAAAAAPAAGWSEVQELALVKALKAFPKELGQERWVKISEVVPGKSKVDCFKRFKELQESFKAKKAAGGKAEGGDE